MSNSTSGWYFYSLKHLNVFIDWDIVEADGPNIDEGNSHYSFTHNSIMYVINGINPESLSIRPTIHAYNKTSNTWSLISYLPIDLFSDISVYTNDMMADFQYFLNEANNKIVSLDLTHSTPKFQVLYNEKIKPKSLIYHSSFASDNKIYIFGGQSAYDTHQVIYYNDLWEFDLQNLTWTLCVTNGNKPSARSSFASEFIAGEYFFVFGGKGNYGNLDDLFYYHVPSKTWHSFDKNGDWPESRSNACMASYDSGIYLVGGSSDSEVYCEIFQKCCCF